FVRALAKNSSFGFFSVGFRFGKNQMCYLCGGLSLYVAQLFWLWFRYGMVREYHS
ncbi:unnamed protein product, partial [Chrysoparadoxa australica]